MEPKAVVIAGPAGVGKTTVGRALAQSLGWEFLDADDLHTPASIERMRSGLGLGDEERWPWLQQVRSAIVERLSRNARVVVACSALRDDYRQFLVHGRPDVAIVVLDAPPDVLRERLEQRDEHFAGVSLLEGQLATFQRPGQGHAIDASIAPQDVVAHIVRALFRGE